MKVLVTGGAGYIGAHVVKLLVERGDDVVVVDDLVTGSEARLGGVPVQQLNLADTSSVDQISALLRERRIQAVIHFAARKQVPESIERPAWYFQQNMGAMANLLLAMESAHVQTLVFSSSAAVYGASEGNAIGEDAPTRPINPYGETKLAGEWLVEDAVRASGLRAASLRYFNVAGAGWPELGDSAVLNLVPLVFARIDSGLAPVIFGGDYDTPDGTCVRDYIHVLDLAEAHLAVLDNLQAGDARHCILNVGTGQGYSVLEMVHKILEIAEVSAEPEIRGRRPGDPAVVVADPRRIQQCVRWQSRLGLSDIVSSAWQSHLLLRNRGV